MSTEPRIAIVGLGGLFPGARDLDEFWNNVACGVDTSREVPPGRWLLDPADVLAPGIAVADHVHTSRGYYLDQIPEPGADLRIDRDLLGRLDPVFHLILHAGSQAFAEAATPSLDRERVGVILGHIALPTEKASALAVDILGRTFAEKLGLPDRPPSTNPVNRWVAGLPAGVLASALGLGGGWYTLDAACASSLYALKLAADELRSGRADLMLTGGAARPDCLYTQMGFAQLRALSPSGRCSPFDAAGDGLVVGEGCGILAIKRLNDAVRDGNTIYGVLAGAGLSNDVEGSLLAPASEGQLRAMREAYGQAGWSPSDVDLIECHATGTPVGDAVEFASLRSLWCDQAARPGQCVIGSVKSTVGHLLTGAGSAGLIKVLLAMRHGVLPPTANFRQPQAQVDLQSSSFRILTHSEPWQRRTKDAPRRAAISGFGFGGINAHLLLEEYLPAPHRVQIVAPPKADAEPVAIVGLEARFGPWQSLRSFESRVLGFADGAKPTPKRHSWGVPSSDWARRAGLNEDHFAGYFIDEFSVPLDQFRIPPKELEEMLPQQLLMLQVAAAALADSKDWRRHCSSAGVFLGLGLDLNTTNFHFRWWVLEAARRWRRQQPHEIDEAEFEQWIRDLRDAAHPALNANRTMGALGSIAASRVARAFQFGGPSFTICSEDTSGGSAFEVAVRALQRGELDLALAGAIDLAGDVRALLSNDAATSSLNGVFEAPRDASHQGEGAAAIVLKRLSDAQRDGDRIYAVVRGVGSTSGGRATTEIGNVPVTVSAAEDVGHTGAASFMASLAKTCLMLHRQTLAPDQPSEHLPNSAEERRTKPQFWLTNRDNEPRRAAIVSLGIGDSRVHAVLEEWNAGAERAMLPSADLGGALFALSAGSAIESDDRIYGAPTPLGPTGQIAFVFPGSGNHFPGMGRELAAYWPAILHRHQRENTRLRDQIAPEVTWNDRRRDEFDPVQAMFGQVTLGCLVSDLLQSFGIRPNAALGCSLGETAALFALRAWTGRDEMLQRMQRSTLFHSDLTGPCHSARSFLKLPADKPFDWTIGSVACSADRIRAEIRPGEQAYLLIISTPEECVIGGERRAVAKLIDRLKARYIPLPAVSIAHCELVRPVAKAYRELHLLPTNSIPDVRFYSGASGTSYELTSENAADAILGHALNTIDFPRLIERAYADGVRLFVEVGPGDSCSRMIGRILRGRPHVAQSACVAYADPVTTLLKLLATLRAQGVPLNLDPLGAHRAVEPAPSQRMLRIQVGGKPFEIPTPPKPIDSSLKAIDSWPGLSLRSPGERPDRGFEDSAPATENNSSLHGFGSTLAARADAHAQYLRFQDSGTQLLSRIMAFSNRLLGEAIASPEADQPLFVENKVALDTAQCREFAVGSIARVFGPAFAEADSYPTRVRLPDGPLMLVDHIIDIEGEPRSLASGRVVTDHLVHENRWYIEEGHIPTAICVEAGQADLFLSGYLGIDFVTKGLAVYRLLDAVVTFYRELPKPGELIRYDIHIDRFFRQGETHLFQFRFEGSVNGEPLLTMRDGCAGFFTAEELAAGKGIVKTALDRRPMPCQRPTDWRELVPMKVVEAYDDEKIRALRAGDLAACFGDEFSGLPLTNPLTLPSGMLKLVDRVVELNPTGGRYGLGSIRAEMDIHPDDWFLTCHFVDDMVMPGTLMYECCLHTLRIFLLRMGWGGEKGQVSCEPVPNVPSQLKCRGQVIASTKTVTYEVTIKEVGYGPEPFAICDALMYADGKPIVEITNMTLRMAGATREQIEQLWAGRQLLPSTFATHGKPPLFDRDRILAFAIGKPSDAFGDRYRIFDSDRLIARLPGPPYQFLDRIVEIRNCQPWQMVPGGEIVAEYDVPPDEWYFAANRQPTMPFSVLLEIALQPCGWLAAYVGSALTSDEDLSFRNLGGTATIREQVGPDIGTLSIDVKITRVSTSGGMIIQNYDFRVRAGNRTVYDGNTLFGFFSKSALAQQVGIRDAIPFKPDSEQLIRAHSFPMPDQNPFPDQSLRMMDNVESFIADGGSRGLGWVRGTKRVNPDEWFFKAHFLNDPVWPGSLGLEAFLQLLKVVAVRRWGKPAPNRCLALGIGHPHTWTYRGQVIPSNREVTVEADITAIDDVQRLLRADGYLTVDGRTIYQMKDFTLRG